MSRLSNLLRQVETLDPQLAANLKLEIDALSGRRAFGLNFEHHIPETVELPGRPVRRGDKVRFLPERGEKPSSVDRRLWRVGRIRRADEGRVADLIRQDPEAEHQTVSRAVDNLVVVAEFRDPIYPGLVSTGKVERGGDKPFHTVINAENFHALQVLLYTHEGKVDAIYIDPPYNTGARDWKYNNDYVDSDDAYRHSKWLAMMERRLKLAKRLLNPESSALIVTIDEKEYLRLGLLLQQVFEASRVQMVSITISPRGTNRASEFSRVDEYAFFVFLGSASVQATDQLDGDDEKVRWQYLRRGQKTLVRGSRPNQFYPIYVDMESERIAKIGSPMRPDESLRHVPNVPGAVPVFPIDPDGVEKIWGLTPATLRAALNRGYVRVTPGTAHQPYTISYLTTPNIKLAEGLLAQHKEKVAAASKGILQVQGETLVVRVVGGEVRECQTFVEAADEHSVEADFKAACRTLTADLARKYADYLSSFARGDENDDDLFDAHVKVAALAQVDGVSDELDRETEELVEKWFGKYRVAVKGLTDERRAVYDEIKGMSPKPQAIDIKRPRVRTEETKNADGKQMETRTGHLMSDRDGDYPIGSLNQWELPVLDREMGLSGFLAWYRNPQRPSGEALAIAYQNAQGHWCRMCPDFLFFHGDSENIKVSIVDPHGHHLADALPKLRGLAKFAATHGASFHRIESVARMTDGTLRVLDLTDPHIQETITEAEDAQALYLGPGAYDY